MEMSFPAFFLPSFMFYKCRWKLKISHAHSILYYLDDYRGSYVFAREHIASIQQHAFHVLLSLSQFLFTDFVEIKSRTYFLPRRNSKGIG